MSVGPTVSAPGGGAGQVRWTHRPRARSVDAPTGSVARRPRTAGDVPPARPDRRGPAEPSSASDWIARPRPPRRSPRPTGRQGRRRRGRRPPQDTQRQDVGDAEDGSWPLRGRAIEQGRGGAAPASRSLLETPTTSTEIVVAGGLELGQEALNPAPKTAVPRGVGGRRRTEPYGLRRRVSGHAQGHVVADRHRDESEAPVAEGDQVLGHAARGRHVVDPDVGNPVQPQAPRGDDGEPAAEHQVDDG